MIEKVKQTTSEKLLLVLFIILRTIQFRGNRLEKHE